MEYDIGLVGLLKMPDNTTPEERLKKYKEYLAQLAKERGDDAHPSGSGDTKTAPVRKRTSITKVTSDR